MTLSRVVLVAAGALSCVPAAHAAGLGRMSVQSRLGEPLRVEIEIVALGPGEESSLEASLASRDAYARAGIEVNPVLATARLTIDRRAGGAVVLVQTLQRVVDPYIDLLVELRWATGRLVRRYSALLDPPGFDVRGPAAGVSAPAPAPPAPAAAAPVVPEPPKPEPRIAERSAAAAAEQAAAKPVDDSPKFEIRGYVFDGATLVARERLEAATAPYTGRDRNFGDVQRALEAVERLYAQTGYSAVQILLPEQALERGDIRFQVIEAKLGRVLVEGNKHFDQANILASVPSLVAGRAPNIREVGRNLRVANENPAKQATVLLRSGREEATVDAVVRVVDEKPIKNSITIDTSGTKETGRLRLGLGLQNGNFGDGDNVLTLQLVGAPHEDGDPSRLSLVPSRRVFIFGVGYRAPLYERGDSIDITAGYSNVDSGTVGNLFSVSGAGGVFGLRYTQNLDRVGDYDHRIAYAWDYRGFHFKDIRQLGSAQQAQPDVTVHPISLTYHGLVRRADSETGFSAGVARNVPGGNDGRPENFCQLGPNPPHGFSRSDGMGNCPDPEYVIWRWSFNHNQALSGDWQWRLGLSGQSTRDMLVSGEQFGLGGADSVRGFQERAIADDKGYRGVLELYTPDFGGKTGVSGARARGLLFYDFGGVSRNRPVPPDPRAQHIGSAGVGVRFSRGSNLSFRMDWGWVLDEGGTLGLSGSAGTYQGRGDGRLHASFTYIF